MIRSASFLACAVVAATVTAPANAITFHWTGAGGAGNPDFDDQINWDPGGTSTSWPNDGNDVAAFDTLLATYTVDFDSSITNDRFEVRVGNPTFDLHDSGIPISFAYTYTLDTTTSPAAIISTFPGALFGTCLTLSGGSVGGNRSTVQTSQVLQIAVGATNTQGILNLNGTNWTSTAASLVGLNGNGTLNIDANSTMTSHSGVLGFTAGSQGTATVDGTWNNTVADLAVGKSGTGTLNINGGGLVHALAGDISIAELPGSVGTVTIANDGKLESEGSLYVGGGPTGPGGTGSLITGAQNPALSVSVGGSMVIYPEGDVTIINNVYVEDNVVISPGGYLGLGSGELVVIDDLTGAADTMEWANGRLFVGGEIHIDANAPLGETEVVNGSKILETNLLKVGPTAAGSLTINNVATGSVTQVGSLIPGTDPATLTVSGAGAELLAATYEVRGTSLATMNVHSGAKVEHLFTSLIAATVGTSAEVNISNPGTLWDATNGSLYVGGDLTTPGGTATINVTDQATMDINFFLKLWPGATMLVDDATLTVGDLEVAGSLTLRNNAVLNTGITTDVTVSGSLDIESTTFDLTDLTITEGGHVTFGNQFVTIDPLGTGNIEQFSLQGGTLTTLLTPIEFLTSTFQGYGTLDGSVVADKGVLATGDLTMGRPDVVNAVQISEEVAFTVGTHHVTLLTKGFWNMHAFTRILGGTLSVPDGISMRSGLYLPMRGTLDGRMFVNGGSVIEADAGDITLGDAGSPAGFFSDGELITNQYTATILDANRAVLGSLTTLGLSQTAGNPGTLTAPNGFLLEPGKNVVGYGVVNGAFTNNGYVQGIGPDAGDEIEFTGNVSGTGDYTGNLRFSAGFEPGISPNSLTIDGNVTLSGTAELEIGLGGLIAGSQHDQLIITGDFIADGDLNIVLLNGFTPSLGDTYHIVSAGSVTGTFDNLIGSGIGGGFALGVIYNATDILLEVINALQGDLDGDGFVGINDLNIVLSNWNLNVPPGNPLADPSGDGFVGIDDLNTVLGNWNAGTPPPGEASTSIPEPACLAIFGLGLSPLLNRPTRRSTHIS